MEEHFLLEYIDKLEEGYQKVFYKNKAYGLTKKTFAQGKSYKIYAEELGGNDFISLNLYLGKNSYLKPCEMAEKKVVDFLMGLVIKR